MIEKISNFSCSHMVDFCRPGHILEAKVKYTESTMIVLLNYVINAMIKVMNSTK